MRANTIVLMPGVLTEQTQKAFKHEYNDCTVLWFSNALEIPYETAHEYIKIHGKRKDRHGISFYAFDFNVSFWDVKDQRFNTVNRLIRFGNRNAIYLVLVNGHLTCIKHGKIVDRFAKNWKIRHIWEVIKRNQQQSAA